MSEDRLTREERDVIAEAEKRADCCQLHGGDPLVFAVRALRESRKPKPKWRAEGHEVTDGMIQIAVYAADGSATPYSMAARIADLLNHAEET